MGGGDPGRPAVRDDDVGREAFRHHVEAAIAAAVAREGYSRVAGLDPDRAAEADLPPALRLRPPLRSRHPPWGWSDLIRFAVERRGGGDPPPPHLRRYVRRRLAGGGVAFAGMAFLERGVELHATPGQGRVVVGPWCRIGAGSALRAEEGQITLGEGVVVGRGARIVARLDVEVGDGAILDDDVRVLDFDRSYDRLDLPVRDQGVVTAPVRIGAGAWIGHGAVVLPGVDVGDGAVLASRCVVDRDIPPFSVADGHPARVVRSRLPEGMGPEEALAMLRAGRSIPGDARRGGAGGE